MGLGVEADTEKAFSLFKQAAELGDGNGRLYLAMCYRTGSGVQEDHKEADKLFRKAAENGDCGGQFRLAHSCFAGQTPCDNEETLRLSRMMANTGSSYAQFNLGVMYREGILVHQDLKEAVRFFRMAAEGGSNRSRVQLGEMFKQGSGVASDMGEAPSSSVRLPMRAILRV